MIDERRAQKEHQAISELIPWFVNGTLGELERQRVDAHLRACAACRDDLLQEQRVYQAMVGETSVEYMPASSLKRLHAKLDGARKEAAPVEMAASPAIPVKQPTRRWMPWQRRIAASIAVAVVVLSLLTMNQWARFRTHELSPDYQTVTTSRSRAPDEVIRAVFSPSITLVELQAILDEAQLRIVAGPTEAGVYSLARNSERPVHSSLALLRRHSDVRFAESTELNVTGSPSEPP
jgi:anti-sigma factor RsiW